MPLDERIRDLGNESDDAPDAAQAPVTGTASGVLREFGIGAQILRELGLHKIRLDFEQSSPAGGSRGIRAIFRGRCSVDPKTESKQRSKKVEVNHEWDFESTVIEGHIDAKGLRLGVVVSRFNAFITEKLLEGCRCGGRNGGDAKDVTIAWVPGAFEMPLVAKALGKRDDIDAVVCLGAVIRVAPRTSIMLPVRQLQVLRVLAGT